MPPDWRSRVPRCVGRVGLGFAFNARGRKFDALCLKKPTDVEADDIDYEMAMRPGIILMSDANKDD